MAVPTGTFLTYTAIGNREDLADAIYDISPTDTPFLSNATMVRATAVKHEWQTDSLTAAANNAQLEGDDATAVAVTPTVRLNNYLQISTKVTRVSGTQNAVDSAGRAEEFSYQLTRRGREIKRDMEVALTQNNGSTAGAGASARQLGGLESWLASNYVSVGTGTAQTTPGFASGTVDAPTDSTVQGAYTETSLKAVIKSCWDAGGDPTMILSGSFNKQTGSGFSGVATAQRDTGNARVRIIGAADLYVSDFGEHAMVPNRFQRDRTIFALDFDYLAVATLRDMSVEPLAKTGDSERAMIVTEYTLEVRNEAASGKVTDATTS